MSARHGEDWQLVEPATRGSRARVEVGMTWARGLREERLEDTGALALVLTALSRELERPVDLGGGRTGVPRAEIELDADVCGIRLSGFVETVRAAVQRLPHLVTRPLIAEGLMPQSLPGPLWREDLLARTGSTALALQGMGAVGAGARQEARRLLPEFAPQRGSVNCLFWTGEETLLGTVRGTAPRTATEGPTWADGTEDGGHAMVLTSRGSAELLSVMVPRTLEGHTAGELLRIALAEALTVADSEGTTISLQSQGMGEQLRVVVSTDPPLADELRPQVLTEVLRRIGRLPDTWIGAVLAHTTCPPWLERGRRVRGLGEMPEATTDGVRRALAEAERSIHLALDPMLLDFADQRRLLDLPVSGPAQEDPTHSVRVFPAARRTTGVRVRLTRGTLAVEDSSRDPEANVVDFDKLVAVLESPSGALRLVDRAGSSVRVRTEELEEGHQLERYLAHVLHRVPRLSLGAESALRHTTAEQQRRSCLGVLGGGVLMTILVIVVMSFLGGSEDSDGGQDLGGSADGDDGQEEAWSTQELVWDETVELSNGTRITAGQPTIETGEEDLHLVTVTFCGGADTEGVGSDGEPADEMTQNVVRSEDFTLYSASDVALPPHDGTEAPEDLPSDWLDDGECVTGDLRFHSTSAEGVDLVYRNSLGDRIIWSND